MSTTTGQTDVSAPRPTLDPERWVEEHCDVLYRYALVRVSNPDTARDLVQEAFLAAWRSAERFAGNASERTWLMRILRNKIVDHYRKRRPEFSAEGINELAELEAKQFVQSGLHRGGWTSLGSPGNWKDAAERMEDAEFWEVVHRCVGKLPGNAAQVFLMREVEGDSTDEICSTLNISRNHLGVLLHRARLALRRCLELSWFLDGHVLRSVRRLIRGPSHLGGSAAS